LGVERKRNEWNSGRRFDFDSNDGTDYNGTDFEYNGGTDFELYESEYYDYNYD
jgi:hypothetical protein